LKRGFDTINQIRNQREHNSYSVKNTISKGLNLIDTDENKNNFLKIYKNNLLKYNNLNSNRTKDNNTLIVKNVSDTLSKNTSKKRDEYSGKGKYDMARKNQNNLENKFIEESIPYNEIVSKIERSFFASDLLKEEEIFTKNFHTLNNNNSKSNNKSNYDEYHKTFENSSNNNRIVKRLEKTDLFNYEIKTNDSNQFPKVIDYSSCISRSKSDERKSSFKNDERKVDNRLQSDKEFHHNKLSSNVLKIDNHNFSEEILKCKISNDVNKKIDNICFLNNFLNSSEECGIHDNDNLTNENSYNDNNQVYFKNRKFFNEIDEKYNKIKCLISGKHNFNEKNEKENKMENKKEKVEKKNCHIRTKHENKNQKEIFRFKNFKSKCRQRSRSFSKSISKNKSRSVSADDNRYKPSKQSNILKNDVININNISNISETEKRNFSQYNKKIKEIASQRGIPKKTPIILNNLKLNFIKFVKPTYNVVYCDKERICKYRNKLIDPFNFNNNLKEEVENFGNILKNSELYTKRNKSSFSLNKVKNNAHFSKLKTNKNVDSLENNKITIENLSSSKSNKFSKKIKDENSNDMNYKINNKKNIDSGDDLPKGRNRHNKNVSLKKLNQRADIEFCDKKQSNFTSDDIIPWLEDLDIIKSNTITLDDLSAISSSGILLADLINRLEGVFIYI